MKLHLDLPQIWTGYSKILDNRTAAVKQFELKQLLSVHKSDKFKRRMSFSFGPSYSCYIVDTLS